MHKGKKATMTYNIFLKSVRHKYLSVALVAYTVVALAAFFLFRPLCSPTLWQGTTTTEYVHEFSNMIPFYTVIEAIETNSRNLFLTLLAHLLAGIFPGYAAVLLCPTLITNRRGRLKLYSIILCGLILFYWVRVLLKCGSLDIDDVLMDMVGLWGGIKVGLMHQSAKKGT